MNSQPNPERYDGWLIFIGGAFACFVFFKVFLKAKLWLLGHPLIGALVGSVIAIIIIMAFIGMVVSWKDERAKVVYLKNLFKKQPDSMYLGLDPNHNQIFLPLAARKTHAQLMGATGTGKSELLLQFAVNDMKANRGFILVDGKPEKENLARIVSYLHETGRIDDFKLFSFANKELSCTFNPLIGDTVEEVADRVMQAFDFEDPYYKGVQRAVVFNSLKILRELGLVPTFKKLVEIIKKPDLAVNMAGHTNNQELSDWANEFKSLPSAEREKRSSGLIANLDPFANGDFAELFNAEQPDIDLKRVLSKNDIVYFQIPALTSANLGKHTGRFILQCLASSTAYRHKMGRRDRKFYGVFLDDFAEYLYEDFLTILNKARSADIGIMFAHQATGDLESLGPAISNGIVSNSILKVLMRSVDSQTAEACSKLIGTKATEKFTSRAKKNILGHVETGDTSVRDTESFIVSPNVFKNEMGVGDAQVLMPHLYGAKHVTVKCAKLPELPAVDLLKREHSRPVGIPAKYLVFKTVESPEKNSFQTTAEKKNEETLS